MIKKFIHLLMAISLLTFFPLKILAKEIILGTSAAFQGQSKALGIELYRGSQAYFNYINNNGGIEGDTIKVITYNDGYNPIPTIYNTIKLIQEDQVFALFNYVGTPTVTRMLPLLYRYQKNNIKLFFPFTGAQPQRQNPYQDLVLNLRASYSEETEGLVDNFVKIGNKRIAVFYQIDAYGRSGWVGVRKGLEKYNLKIVEEATYRRGTSYETSMEEQVNILKKSNPDAIISIGSYAACAAFIRDARDQGLNIPIANISFVGSESLLNLLEETGEENNKDYTKNLINSQVVPSYEDINLKAIEEYRQLMAQYHNSLPTSLGNGDYESLPYSFISLEGFLNAKLMVEILKEMKASFGEYKQEYLDLVIAEMGNIDLGINSDIVFNEGKNQGLNQVYYTTIENGKYVSLTDWQKFSENN